MRIDLFRGGRRPWYMSLGLQLVRWYTGAFPGPPVTISYRPDFFHRSLIAYILRGMLSVEGATTPALRQSVICRPPRRSTRSWVSRT